MTIKVQMIGDIKKVLQAGEFCLNSVYLLTGGWFSGRLIKIDYISPFKQVMIDGKRCRQVHGELLGSDGGKINTVIDHLQIQG